MPLLSLVRTTGIARSLWLRHVRKHVYCEKPLSWTVPETYMVRQVIKETGVVFQLGHQGRQTDCYQKAEEIIGNGLLGPVNLIEVCTNRNSPMVLGI